MELLGIAAMFAVLALLAAVPLVLLLHAADRPPRGTRHRPGVNSR